MEWEPDADEEQEIMNEFLSSEAVFDGEDESMHFDEDDKVPEETAKAHDTVVSAESSFQVEVAAEKDIRSDVAYSKQEIDDTDRFALSLKKGRSSAAAKSFAFIVLRSSLDLVTQSAEQIHYCEGSGSYLQTVPPSTGEYLSCTLLDGSIQFLSKRPPTDVPDIASLHTQSGNLLQMPMSALMERAIELEVQSKVQKARVADLKVSDLTEADQLLYENLTLEKSLWVEKYKPRNFIELLSPEKINREVLRSLKQWDRYVFKKKNPTMPEKPSYSSARYGFKQGGSKSNESTAPSRAKESKPRGADVDDVVDNSGNDDDDPADDDELGHVRDWRPEYKVLLLSGPPGTGKTTLAHILATHCGYRPFEVNASDDRTCDVLKDLIVSAMTANTVTGDKRPNCIILDEADGIDNTATIDMIVNMSKAPLRGDAKTALNSVAKKGKKGTSPTNTVPLTRPIICICNDHFAPVLKSLKKVSQVFVFQPPEQLRLVNRLKSICSSEGVDVNSSLLSDLCTASGNDIRSCLNSLQFAAMKALVSALNKAAQEGIGMGKQSKKDISTTLMHMMRGGLNDKQKDVFTVWKEIFNSTDLSKERAFQKKLSNTVSESGEVEISRKVEYEVLSTMVSESGDDSLILSGVHENLPKVRFNDPDMSRLLVSMEWLSFTDYLEQFARKSSGGYQVMPYAASYAVAVHTFCAQDNRSSKLEWPFKDRNEFYKRQQRSNLLHNVVFNANADLHSRSSIVTSGQVLVCDVLSALVDILTPRIRAISWTSLSPPEKNALLRVVEVMASCGLSYVPVSSVIGSTTGPRPFGQDQSDLVLEPNLAELVAFTLAKQSNTLKKSFPREDRVSLSLHTALHDETKRTIQRELKTFLIQHKHGDLESFEKIPLGVPEESSAPKNSTSYYTKTETVVNSAAEVRRGEEEAEEERQIQLKAKRGRMDMFCTSKPKVPKFSTADKDSAPNKIAAAVSTSGVKNFGTTKASIVSTRPKIFFKFNQGYSNAVKRPVNISEFL